MLWLVLAGIWIFLSHLVLGVGLALTIIGIPFALQHLKFGMLALAPFFASTLICQPVEALEFFQFLFEVHGRDYNGLSCALRIALSIGTLPTRFPLTSDKTVGQYLPSKV